MYQPWQAPGQGPMGDQHAAWVDMAVRDAVEALIATEDRLNKAWVASMRRGWAAVGAIWVYALMLLLLGVDHFSLTFALVAAAAAGAFVGQVAGVLATRRLVVASRKAARRSIPGQR